MLHVFFVLSVLITVGYSTPILGGQNVGEILGDFRIIGQTEFPFMAHLYIIDKYLKDGTKQVETFICGGVIISEYAVLTAAHCIAETKSKPKIYVRAGFVDYIYEGASAPSSWAEDYTINEGYIHHYDVSKNLKVYLLSDIAIVWLETPFLFGPTLKAASLLQYDGSLQGAAGWTLGWGIDETGKNTQILKKVAMKVISAEECQKSHRSIFHMPDVFCMMAVYKNASLCPGDSGGPFVIDQMVYGITSFGISTNNTAKHTCDPKKPVRFTHLGMFREWIEEKLTERSRKPRNINDNYDIKFVLQKPSVR